MEKTTVYLTTAQKRALETAARAGGRSEAQLIREGVDQVTRRHRISDWQAPEYDEVEGGRTTETDQPLAFEPDVAAAVEQLQRERSAGRSQVVNDLIRAGLVAKPPRQFRQRTRRLGLRIDVTKVAKAIEELEGPTAR